MILYVFVLVQRMDLWPLLGYVRSPSVDLSQR